jgi:hypothetical protein
LRSYAVADTGELWASGVDEDGIDPLGHGEREVFAVPKPIASLRRIKMDAVVASDMFQTLALADDGSVSAWDHARAAEAGVLGLGLSVSDAKRYVPTPRRIPELRVACGP